MAIKGLRTMSVSDVIARRARVARYSVDAIARAQDSDDWREIAEHDTQIAREIAGMLDSGFNVATMRRDIGID